MAVLSWWRDLSVDSPACRRASTKFTPLQQTLTWTLKFFFFYNTDGKMADNSVEAPFPDQRHTSNCKFKFHEGKGSFWKSKFLLLCVVGGLWNWSPKEVDAIQFRWVCCVVVTRVLKRKYVATQKYIKIVKRLKIKIKIGGMAQSRD